MKDDVCDSVNFVLHGSVSIYQRNSCLRHCISQNVSFAVC